MVGEADLRQTGELMRFTISANMAGIPAITVPVGQCSRGTRRIPLQSVASVSLVRVACGINRAPV